MKMPHIRPLRGTFPVMPRHPELHSKLFKFNHFVVMKCPDFYIELFTTGFLRKSKIKAFIKGKSPCQQHFLKEKP